MSAAQGLHQLHYLHNGVLWGYEFGIVGHDLSQSRLYRVSSVGQNAADGITLGEDTDEVGVAFGDQNCADAPAMHVPRRHHYCRARRKHHWIKVVLDLYLCMFSHGIPVRVLVGSN